MPKVAQYEGNQVDMRVSQGPRARNVEIAGPGDLAQGVSDLAKGIQSVAEAADKAAAEQAITGFEKERNDILFNPDTGYFNTQGRDAYDQSGEVNKRLEEARKRYAEGIKSPRAAAAFNRAADAHMNRANADIMRHAAAGAKAWEGATIDSRIENTVENASLYWSDPDALKVQNNLGRNAIIAKAEQEGVGGEALNERLQTYDSSFASATIGAAIAQSSDEGKEMLEKYGSMLEGPDRIKVEAAIEKKIKAETTQKMATQAVTQAGSLVAQFGDADDARARINEAVNEIEDPELRRATSKEATRQLDIKMKADAERRVATQERVENHILEGGSATQWAADHPEEWETLAPEQKRVLLSGKQIVTDHDTLTNLLTLPAEKLALVNPNDYSTKLAPADRNRLTNAVLAARNGSTQGQTGRTRATQVKDLVERVYGTAPKGGYKGKKKEQVNAFYGVIDAERIAREEEKGSPLTSVEFTAMLNEMSREVLVKDRHFGFIDDTMSVSDIPAEELDMLSSYLRANNIPVTGDNLVKAYVQASK